MEQERTPDEVEQEAMHGWFGLSYSNYLVLRRVAIQSMPDEWQVRLRDCLEELRESFGWVEDEGGVASYRVNALDVSGRFVKDPYSDYQRGRRKLQPRTGAEPVPHG